ncbi:type IV pilus biogenesis protein PilM [Achromobacter ruhlandii]|uniref:type IV pilus biogenesis protein PilM n=1 Tax=Achromobacter ruhlandii TaxID=72557 RepID=UPI003B9E4DF3
MQIAGFVLLLVVAFSMLGSQVFQDSAAKAETAYQEGVSATDFHTLMSAARRWAQANPGYTGALSRAHLAPYMPAGLNISAPVQVWVGQGVSYVWAPPGTNATPSRITSNRDLPQTIGYARGGWLYNPFNGSQSIPLPGVIPEGSTVYVG